MQGERDRGGRRVRVIEEEGAYLEMSEKEEEGGWRVKGE